MAKYATGTDVPIERSRDEIQRTLVRYGADRFGYMTGPKTTAIAFSYQGRNYRQAIPVPQAQDFRNEVECKREHRRRWRVALLLIKAKLESVDANLGSFENEFLQYVLLPNGRTVVESLPAEIEKMYLSGKTKPQLLLEGPQDD